MSASHDCNPELARDLIRLARKGAYAAPASPDTDSLYHVLSPRNAFAAPVATLSAAVVEEAQVRGWLGPGPGAGTAQLTREGRRVIRRYLSAGTRETLSTRHKADMPATQRAARMSVVANDRPRIVEGPLAWLRQRKDRDGRPLITEPQFEAGQRFAADYARAQMQARITASWSATAPCMRTQARGAAGDISDAALAARNRVHRAMKAVGPEIGGLLVDVCCHDIGLEVVERARGWPARSSKVVLDMGLTSLARHYGMLAANPSSEDSRTRSPARRWGEPGYTPTLEAWT